jgi:hypothetical protein
MQLTRPYDRAGLTLRQAAITAGIAYLLNPVTYAEFSIYPKLVIAGNIDQTAQNISAHSGHFAVAIGCYLLSFLGDIVLAWSLYHLLAPVNRALSLLASWFQLVYAAIALAGVVNLVAVYQLLTQPDYLGAFGTQQLHAQVLLQLHLFRHSWELALVLFGIHLVLLGYLIFRSSYIPRLVGILLVIAGLGWIVNSAGPYVLPHANIGWTMITAAGELSLTLWLWIRGWKLPDASPFEPFAADTGPRGTGS